jgi:selenocysteine-specific elongation factor
LKHLIMCTAGHIDHGKTALVKALTGTDCDTHPQEKERGITINPGFAHLEIPGRNGQEDMQIGIVDVPGHHRFIRNMVAGACGVDFALLVIAADDGVMPQTREHLAILECLALRDGLIAITKSDLADEELLTMVEDDITEAVKGSFLEKARRIAVSSKTGAGLDDLRAVIAEVTARLPERQTGEVFRMFVDRIFSVAGFGTVVTGSVVGGQASSGDELRLLPGDKEVRVRRIERHGVEVETVRGGDRASLNLVGLKRDEFSRGMLLSDRQLPLSGRIDAQIRLSDPSILFGVYSQAMFYAGTHESSCRIHLIDCDSTRGQQELLAQIELEKPTVMFPGDRFILRSCSTDRTLGGGRVIDPAPLHHRRRPRQLIDDMRSRSSGDLARTIAAEVRKHISFLSLADLAVAIDQPLDLLRAEILSGHLELESESAVQVLETEDGHFLISAQVAGRLQQAVTTAVGQHHKRNPISDQGLSADALAASLNITPQKHGAGIMKQFAAVMLKQGSLRKGKGGGYCLSDFSGQPSERQERGLNYIRRRMKDAGRHIVPLNDLEFELDRKISIPEREMRMLLKYLLEAGELFLFEEVYLPRAMVDQCRRILLEHLAKDDAGITIAAFRDLIVGNRRLCLLLTGIYDSDGHTRRNGDVRFITPAGQQWLESNLSSY